MSLGRGAADRLRGTGRLTRLDGARDRPRQLQQERPRRRGDGPRDRDREAELGPFDPGRGVLVGRGLQVQMGTVEITRALLEGNVSHAVVATDGTTVRVVDSVLRGSGSEVGLGASGVYARTGSTIAPPETTDSPS